VEGEDDPEDRLEAALERIAMSVNRPPPAEAANPPNLPDPIVAEVATRLDHIIATLREELEK